MDSAGINWSAVGVVAALVTQWAGAWVALDRAVTAIRATIDSRNALVDQRLDSMDSALEKFTDYLRQILTEREKKYEAIIEKLDAEVAEMRKHVDAHGREISAIQAHCAAIRHSISDRQELPK